MANKRKRELNDRSGIDYGGGVYGKYLFRVRETYVAESLAPLISQKQVGAAKLDLVLRGIGLLPRDAGEREAGWIIHDRGRVSYEALHDIVRDRRYSDEVPEDEDDDAVVRDRKREWVREHLQILESRKLVERRMTGDGRRPALIVRCDRGDGDLFDDPGGASGAGNSYVTVLGSVIASQHFKKWGGPELAGYLCAMVADRFARNASKRREGSELPPGSATWYRQADWFNNKSGYRPEGHVPLPFSTTTIERGLRALRDQGLIDGERKKRGPDGRRFAHPRMIYKNRFNELGAGAEIIDLTARLRAVG